MSLLRKLIFLFFISFQCTSYAQLKGEVLQDWVVGFVSVCYKAQRSAALNSLMSDDRLSKYCTCYAFKTGTNLLLTNELIDKVNNKQALLPPEIHSGVSTFCNNNYANYFSGAFPESRKINKEFSFDDELTHRFTAIRKIHQNAQRTETKTIDIRIGEDYADVMLSPRSKSIRITLNGLNTYKSNHSALISTFGKMHGVDYGFSFDQGVLSLDTENSTLTIQKILDDHFEITTYILSKKLICESLNSKINQRNTAMLGSMLKEALIFAIRSYSGASYSYGNFTGMTSNGKPFSGGVTFYNNSWMGEHYSSGLDQLFNGAADVSEINRQKVKIGCPA